MLSPFVRRTVTPTAAALAIVFLAAAGSSVLGQTPAQPVGSQVGYGYSPPGCAPAPQAYCPPPAAPPVSPQPPRSPTPPVTPPTPAAPSPTTPSPTTPSPTTPSPTTPSPTDTSAQTSPSADTGSDFSERSGAVGGESVALGSPAMMGDLLVPSGGCRTIKQQRTLRAILSQSRGQSNQSILGSPGRPVNSTAFTLTTNSAGMVTVNQFSQSSQSSYCPEGRTPSSSHSFKFANNDSPLPEDRMFMDANYYNDVNHGSNRAAGITDPIDAYQQTFGFEKTVVFGEASWGMSLPVNLLVDNSGGNTTVNVGNLTVFGKMILWEDQGDDADATLTGGLAVTIPTGPNGFAGARVDGGINDTTIQPYFGYVYRTGSWYLLGFSSLDIPTETADTLMFYNDFSVCYLIPTNLVRGNVKGLIPTLELHVNTPLTHRSDGTLFDPAATPDWLDLTFGFTTLLAGNSSLGLGINVPVTGPLPYTWEGLAQFTMRF